VSHTVILDNEAAQALASVQHWAHAKVVAYFQVIAARKKRAQPIAAVVPTSVRVESGWDRSAPAWAFANRLRIADHVLDTASANAAAAIRRRLGTRISVADAHVGVVIQATPPGRITVLTSDPLDMRSVAETTPVTIVTI
jgi:hypothetical protein